MGQREIEENAKELWTIVRSKENIMTIRAPARWGYRLPGVWALSFLKKIFDVSNFDRILVLD